MHFQLLKKVSLFFKFLFLSLFTLSTFFNETRVHFILSSCLGKHDLNMLPYYTNLLMSIAFHIYYALITLIVLVNEIDVN